MARTPTRAARNPFWEFSIRFYRRPGVAPACLALQDRLGVDVNLLLFCLWTAQAGIALPPRTMAAAVGFSRHWSAQVVKPLRAVRRFLKPLGVPALRSRVAKAELDAERYQQSALHGLLPRVKTGSGGARLAVRHLQRYFTAARLRPRAQDIESLALLLSSAFSGADTAILRTGWR